MKGNRDTKIRIPGAFDKELGDCDFSQWDGVGDAEKALQQLARKTADLILKNIAVSAMIGDGGVLQLGVSIKFDDDDTLEVGDIDIPLDRAIDYRLQLFGDESAGSIVAALRAAADKIESYKGEGP